MADKAPEPGGSAYDLLAPGIQRQLYKMRWTNLRPLQSESIRAYNHGTRDLLLMAETAGGKTEAAFLPVLSEISEEPMGSVRALYVGPLKALINDQFGRLEELCTYLEVPVHRWHGDVAASHKKLLVTQPGGVLLITPESLESLLINRTAHLGSLFGGLRAVVIDELHAFLENERGLHLASLLFRLRSYQAPGDAPFRVLGLSATIGDVTAAQRYLSPDAPESVGIVTDSGEAKEIQFRVHGYLKRFQSDETSTELVVADGTAADAEGQDDDQLTVMKLIATDLVEHCRTHSNLIFANAKGDIEVYADLANELCREQGLPESFLVHHGSLAKEVREDTEITMKAGHAMTTVCSSTLEMGVDIGAVRMVGQIGAPWSVASLKQRMGRSGRKADEPRRLRVYAVCETTKDNKDPFSQIPLDLLQAVAVCELMLSKWVEPPSPAQLDYSTLTHQIMSTIAEVGAIAPVDLYERLCRLGPFRGVAPPQFARLLRCLGEQDIIEQGPDSKLILGLLGEKLRSRKDFYAAFAGKAEYALFAADRLLGSLPIDTVPKEGEHIVFAARRWQVIDVDPARLTIHVQPARRRKRPKFTGTGGEIHPRIRERMRSLLDSDEMPVYLDGTCSAALQEARQIAHERGLSARGVLPLSGQRCLWPTWTGTAAQRTLVALLQSLDIETGDHGVALECRVSAEDLASRVRVVVRDRIDPFVLAAQMKMKQFRKYDYLLSDELLDEAAAADRLDVDSALEVIGSTFGSQLS